MVGTGRRLRIIGRGSSTRLRLVRDWDERPPDGGREARGVERALDKLLREQSLATGPRSAMVRARVIAEVRPAPIVSP
jgi:hypothetical protein